MIRRTDEQLLMSAEYLLDSLMEHVYKRDCWAVAPKARKRVTRALADIRMARDSVRRKLGTKQRTLITAHPRRRPRRSTTWTCDCEEAGA